MPLVQAPRSAHGNPRSAAFVQRELGGVNRAHLERGVHDVGRDGGAREVATGAPSLVGTLLGQGDIDPAGELVLEVPSALAVAQQHERVGQGITPLECLLWRGRAVACPGCRICTS